MNKERRFRLKRKFESPIQLVEKGYEGTAMDFVGIFGYNDKWALLHSFEQKDREIHNWLEEITEPEEITWRDVFCTAHKGSKHYGMIAIAAKVAEWHGYKYFTWNDVVFSTESGGLAGIPMHHIK